MSEVMHLIGEVRGRPGADHRRHHRYGGNAGEDGGGAAERRRDRSVRGVHASGAFRAGGGAASRESPITEVVVTDSVPLSESGAQGGQDQGAERGRTAGARHPFDSRRDVDQRAVYLAAQRAPAKRQGEEVMEQIIVEGKPREDRGKNAARRMRAQRRRCRPCCTAARAEPSRCR